MDPPRHAAGDDALGRRAHGGRVMDTPVITEQDITDMASTPTLGPGWSASRRIADKLMRDWTDERFKALIDEFSKRFNEHLWDDVQASLQSDSHWNVQCYIRQMVDDTVKALLTGQPWALQRYPLTENYEGAEIRAAIAKHVPIELLDKRVADLQAENKRLRESLELLRSF
jgi:hypothetical protein